MLLKNVYDASVDRSKKKPNIIFKKLSKWFQTSITNKLTRDGD